MGLCLLFVNTCSSASLGDEYRKELEESRARGHALAVTHCADCHATGEDDPSPTAVNANTPLRRLSERFPVAMLVEAVRSGSISGHDEMPGFDFTMEEIHDLLAYIDGFAPADKRYLSR